MFGNTAAYCRRTYLLQHLSLCHMPQSEFGADRRLVDVRPQSSGNFDRSSMHLSLLAGRRSSVLRYLRQPALVRERREPKHHRYHDGVFGQSEPVPANLGGLVGTQSLVAGAERVPGAVPEEHSMARQLISSGSQFEHDIGYSRAVVDGEWIFVSGTTGFDYATMTISDNLLDQTEQCLKNIQSALRQAGAELADVVRVTYVVPEGARFRECWPILRKYLGTVRPAAMMISAGLADPRMQIEIEVTARKRTP